MDGRNYNFNMIQRQGRLELEQAILGWAGQKTGKCKSRPSLILWIIGLDGVKDRRSTFSFRLFQGGLTMRLHWKGGGGKYKTYFHQIGL